MAGCWLTQQNRTMAKTLALLFGVIFLVVGALGFVPAATHDVDGMPMLLGNGRRRRVAHVFQNLRNHLCDRCSPRVHAQQCDFDYGIDVEQPGCHLPACCACHSDARNWLCAIGQQLDQNNLISR
jgi:Domain of unknown function (DUF4383)